MIKTCALCGRMYSTLDKECLCAEIKLYRAALERIAYEGDSMWPGGMTMKKIAKEVLGAYSQVLTGDERKAVQEQTPPNP